MSNVVKCRAEQAAEGKMSFLGPFDAFAPMIDFLYPRNDPFRSHYDTDTRAINPSPCFYAPVDPRGWQDRNAVKVDRIISARAHGLSTCCFSSGAG